jgi:hypothetical protein
MITRRILACILALASIVAVAQSNLTPIITFPVFTLNTAPVPGASIQVSGVSGQQTYYYWAVANFQVGSVLSSLGGVSNAPNTLSGSNYVIISPWIYPASVLSVDILRTTSSLAPSGACNCAVATGLTSGSANDQSNSLSSYTVTLLNAASLNLTLTNEVVSSGASHLYLRQGATYPGTLVRDLSLSGGGGSVGGSGTGGYLPEWTGSGSSTTLGNSPIQDTAGLLNVTEPIQILLTSRAVLATTAPIACGGSATSFLVTPACTSIDSALTIPSGTGGVQADIYATTQSTLGSLSSTATLAGSYSFGVFLSSGTPNWIAGAVGVAYIGAGTGTAANASGVVGLGALAGSEGATATILAGLDGQVQNQSSNATTQPFGAAVYARSPSLAAPISHVYGFYVADQTVGGGNNPDPWGIYEAAGKNYFGGTVRILPVTFSALASCASGIEGTSSPVTDSTTNILGATITGSGSNHVMAYCDGTNWTVAAK